jgi:PAS domain S-box-containing protein
VIATEQTGLVAPKRWRNPLRRIAPVALVLALTIAGFLGASLLGKRDARRESEHQAEVAAAQIRGRVADAASLAASLGRYMASVDEIGVTKEEFASTASRWLSPAGFPAVGWVEQVGAADRAAYEKRTGTPIVTRDQRRRIVPAEPRSSYLPATLVSGVPPITVAGLDLGGEAGMTEALLRARELHQPSATPLATLRDGTNGLFLVSSAQREGLAAPGFAVVFVSGESLRAAATDTDTAQLFAGGAPAGGSDGAATVRTTFTEAGQRFDVVVPLEAVPGSAAVLPWIILAAGLVFAAFAAALGVSGARRARAQDELDRIFTLSSDLITVANFNGYFTRVNPAIKRILGYAEEEFLARPYRDFVHPGDHPGTVAETAAIGQGKTTLPFENRYLHKDGSYRVLEWTSTPAAEDRAIYGVARDVTDRHQAEAELARLAGEQAALRRVATLVARDAPQAEVFSAIAEEIGQLLGTEEIRMARHEDEYAVVVAAWGEADEAFPIGSRQPLGDDDSAASRVFRTGRPTRIDNYEAVSSPIAETVRSIGIRFVVATPILVEGRLWGAITTGTSRDEPLPPDTESRLGQFTELMATAIANTESHARADRLAREQAALRRVATLVAKEPSLAEVFTEVAEEVADVVANVDCGLWRDEGDGTITAVAVSGRDPGAGIVVGAQHALDGDSVIAPALRHGRPSRMADYAAARGSVGERARALGIRSAVACPIVVGGRTWGAMVVMTSGGEPLPPETETRIAQFSDLVATAIANTEARAEVERLAEEQAALRRVATLVAEGALPAAVFDAVAAEMKGLLDADHVVVCRYEPGAELTVLAHRGSSAQRVPPGARISHVGDTVEAAVRGVNRSVRMESYEGARGVIAELARAAGVRVAVGAPIVVDGGLWGVISAGWNAEQSPPADTEQRMAQFAQLLDTATANADSRAELIASRARLVAASDEARRRFERDLHDGVQQRLVSLALELNLAETIAAREDTELVARLAHVRQGLTGALDDLRELSRGIHPAILSEGGIVPALKALARRSAVPVDLRFAVDERLADHVEVGAYYVVSEALNNAAKHARASKVDVTAHVHDGRLQLTIADDGVGGADPARGSGLTGLADRVAALGGTIAITSLPAKGTSLHVDLPVVGR